MSKIKAKRGQAVIIVLLVLVVVLTIGLSVATNTVRDIKLSQQTELSNRAFNAAEAGIEAALSGQLAGGTVTVGTGADAASYNVSITTQGGVSGEAFVFNKPIAKDDTQQIWFVGHNADNSLNLSDPLNFNDKDLILYWGNPGQASNNSTTPALEISVIYQEGGVFKMAKGVYDPNSGRLSNNNFLSVSDISGNYLAPYNFQFKKQVDLSQAPFSIPTSGTTLYAVRLRVLYNDVSQLLGAQPADAANTFPVQGRLISSMGTASNVNRKVEVFESYPVLPPIFDYVIFNGSNNSLQK